MTYMECRVCKSLSEKFGSAVIFNNSVSYFECPICGYIQTEKPYWLEKAYHSTMNLTDTGIIKRNLDNLRNVLAVISMIGITNDHHVVDFGAGYGVLVRMLRDKGINAFWNDPFCENLFARGFEYESQNNVKLVTSFETFEHFEDPCLEFSHLKSISSNILISTLLAPEPAPSFSKWWYYGQEHGQHIGFFRLKTLEYLATKHKMNLISIGNFLHFFSKRKYSKTNLLLRIQMSKQFNLHFLRNLKSKTLVDHNYLSGKDNII